MFGGLVSPNFDLYRTESRTTWNETGRSGVRRYTGRLAITWISGWGFISLQTTHSNLIDLARSCTRKIQDILLVLAAVVATPECPHWWASRVISRDILWLWESSAECLVSQGATALSTRPPTLITSSPSPNGLSTLNSFLLSDLSDSSVLLWSKKSNFLPALVVKVVLDWLCSTRLLVSVWQDNFSLALKHMLSLLPASSNWNNYCNWWYRYLLLLRLWSELSCSPFLLLLGLL